MIYPKRKQCPNNNCKQRSKLDDDTLLEQNKRLKAIIQSNREQLCVFSKQMCNIKLQNTRLSKQNCLLLEQLHSRIIIKQKQKQYSTPPKRQTDFGFQSLSTLSFQHQQTRKKAMLGQLNSLNYQTYNRKVDGSFLIDYDQKQRRIQHLMTSLLRQQQRNRYLLIQLEKLSKNDYANSQVYKDRDRQTGPQQLLTSIKKETGLLGDHFDHLFSKISEQQAIIKQLQDEKQRFIRNNTQLPDFRGNRHKSKEAQLSRMQVYLEKKSEQLQRQEISRKQQRQILAKQKQQLELLKRNILNIKQQNKSYRSAIEQLKLIMSKRQKQLMQRDQQLKKAKSQAQQSHSQLRQRIDWLQRQKQKYANEVGAELMQVKRSNAQLWHKNQLMNKHLTNLSIECQSRIQESNNLKKKNEQLDETLKQQRIKSQAMTEKVRQLLRRATGLSLSKKVFCPEIESLNKTIGSQEQVIRSLRVGASENFQLRDRVAQLQKQLQAERVAASAALGQLHHMRQSLFQQGARPCFITEERLAYLNNLENSIIHFLNQAGELNQV